MGKDGQHRLIYAAGVAAALLLALIVYAVVRTSQESVERQPTVEGTVPTTATTTTPITTTPITTTSATATSTTATSATATSTTDTTTSTTPTLDSPTASASILVPPTTTSVTPPFSIPPDAPSSSVDAPIP